MFAVIQTAAAPILAAADAVADLLSDETLFQSLPRVIAGVFLLLGLAYIVFLLVQSAATRPRPRRKSPAAAPRTDTTSQHTSPTTVPATSVTSNAAVARAPFAGNAIGSVSIGAAFADISPREILLHPTTRRAAIAASIILAPPPSLRPRAVPPQRGILSQEK